MTRQLSHPPPVPAAEARCPIQDVFWLEWDITALDLGWWMGRGVGEPAVSVPAPTQDTEGVAAQLLLPWLIQVVAIRIGGHGETAGHAVPCGLDKMPSLCRGINDIAF
jgi:hypothetical protein